MNIKLAIFSVAATFATMVAVAPATAAFTLSNTNGGDGYVTGTDDSFDLFGSDNESGDNTTAFTTIATKAQTYLATYTYTTNDCCGSFYDPAGLVFGVAGSKQLRLSPLTSAPGISFSGSTRFRALVGDTYGFYVSSDGEFGRADIAVTLSAVVPEPATWALMITGFSLVGSVMRRRTALTA